MVLDVAPVAPIDDTVTVDEEVPEVDAAVPLVSALFLRKCLNEKLLSSFRLLVVVAAPPSRLGFIALLRGLLAAGSSD